MDAFGDLLQSFVAQSQENMGKNLVGIYLHGSAAMGCFHWEKSDIDLLLVVKDAVPNDVKRRFMDRVVELNAIAPPRGIELSVVKRAVCNPFVYPTPFELHFSVAHLRWYQDNPLDYIEKMKGTDKDLAAHFTVIVHRGKCLYGDAIEDVFGPVGKEDYFDSIWSDIERAETQIMDNPTYTILNLCRVLAYQREGLILSKQEGGQWGMRNVPQRDKALIAQALDEYASNQPAQWDEDQAHAFAATMIAQIGRSS